MAIQKYTLSKVSFAIILALGTSSCASLFNPHLTLPTKDYGGTTRITMPKAVAYADKVIASYRDGMGDQAYLNSLTGTLIIPASAVALAYGIQGTHSNSITNIAVGGAGVYSLSSWLSSPNRSSVYAEGIIAINCAKQVMLPYDVDAALLTEFEGNLNELETAIATLSTAIGKVQNSYSGTVPPKRELIEKALSLALDTLKSASGIAGNGYKLKLRLNRAALTLEFAVDRIHGEVDKALIATVPSLSTLPGIVASLTQTADQFRQVKPVNFNDAANKANEAAGFNSSDRTQADKNRPHDSDVNSENLRKDLVSMAKAIAALGTVEEKVRAMVAIFDQPISNEALLLCGVSNKELIAPLRVQPDNSIKFTAQKAGSEQRLLTGGSGKYVVTDSNKRSGVLLEQPVPLGPAINISSTAQTPVGQTKLLVQDTNGQLATIDVEITAASQVTQPGGANLANPPETAVKLNAFEIEFNKDSEQVQAIQRALVVCIDAIGDKPIKVDGVIGSETRAAVTKCQESSGHSELGQEIVDKLRSNYLEGNLPKSGLLTGAEKLLSKDKIKDLYGLLGVPDSDAGTPPIISSMLRQKLLEFQVAFIGKSSGTGVYSNELMVPLCKAKDPANSKVLCQQLR